MKKRPFVLVRSNKYSGNPFGRNDPYDENGNGYGGGNNDVPTAIELGKRATKYGMKVCIDFHYSDFWADPKRQHTPKAWEGMDLEEKSNALYDFTKDSLKQMLDAGVNVSMVQIGNEINYGMCGETIAGNVTKLLKSGSRAVREISDTYDQDIQIVVHYTNITQSAVLYSLIKNLQTSELDYDIIGLSYYPFWDGDGNANSLAGTDDLVDGYPATVQGQTDMIRDVIAAANDAGLYYGGSAWDNQAFFDFEGHPLESLKLFNYLKEGTK